MWVGLDPGGGQVAGVRCSAVEPYRLQMTVFVEEVAASEDALSVNSDLSRGG